jgi:hypothetical protein
VKKIEIVGGSYALTTAGFVGVRPAADVSVAVSALLSVEAILYTEMSSSAFQTGFYLFVPPSSVKYT